MLDNMNRLDLTAKDIELIEAALHTQKKILSVQSEAGGTGARQKLSDLKHLIKRVGKSRPNSAAQPSTGFFAAARNLFCATAFCPNQR